MLFKTATSRNIFAIVAVGVVATVATAGSLFVMSYNQAETATAADMNAVAKVSASQIQGRIQTNMQIVYSIRDTMQAMAADRAGDRVTADRMLSEIQSASAGTLGVWTGWEPNAFDGRDSDFANKGGHTDSTGRYIPYATSGTNGQINFDPLIGYELPGDGDYYRLARKAGKPVILEPFAYDLDGVSTLMTSLTAPIVVGGKVVGVAGADIGLADVATALGAMQPMGTGFVALV